MADQKRYKLREVTVPEAETILKNILKTDIVPFLWGAPGIGKSSIVKKIAKEGFDEIIDLRLSLLNPIDLRGLPTINHEKQEAKWLPPSFLPPQNATNKGILFLDEINKAHQSVQAAAYQLILDKQVGEYKFPKTWKIVAAGNREKDRSDVFRISAALANRFVHLTIRPDFYKWKDWAVQSGIHPTVVSFLTMSNVALFDFPNEDSEEKAFASPRSWQFASELLDAFDYDEAQDVPDDLAQAIMGAVGEGRGRELIEYLNQFKLKEITKKLEEFIKTGKITLPRSTSLRLTIVGTVFEAYLNGKIDQVKYDMFTSKLTSEEQQTIKQFEIENADKIAKRNKNIQRMPSGKISTKTNLPLSSLENKVIRVEDTSAFEDSGTLLIISPDGTSQEIVSYNKKSEIGFLDIIRAAGAAGRSDFPTGSLVTQI